MNYRHTARSIAAVALAVLVSACDKTPTTPPEIPESEQTLTLLSEPEASVPYSGGTVTVSFETNMDWEITLSNIDWATVSPALGKAGKGTVTATILGNPDPKSGRNLTLTVKAGKKSAKVEITQTPKEEFFLSDGKGVPTIGVELDSTPQAFGFWTNGNVEYKAVTNDEWLIRMMDEGAKPTSRDSITYFASINKGSAREGFISFQDLSGNELARYNVRQREFNQMDPFFVFYGLEPVDEVHIDNAGGEASFVLHTGLVLGYTFTCDWSELAGIAEGLDTTFKFMVQPNTSGERREAKVEFLFPELSGTSAGDSYTIYLVQDKLAE